MGRQAEAWHERTRRDESNAWDEQEEQREEAPHEEPRGVKPRSAIQSKKLTNDPPTAYTHHPSLHTKSAGTTGIACNSSNAPLLLIAAALALETRSEWTTEE